MKIRIFALAKELGLDSKDLIDYCNRAGIELKNSPLASITPEQRDLVLQFIDGQGASAPVEDEPTVPLRSAPPERTGRIRKIEAPSRPQGSGSSTGDSASGRMDEAADESVAVATVDEEAAPESESLADTAAEVAPASEAAGAEPPAADDGGDGDDHGDEDTPAENVAEAAAEEPPAAEADTADEVAEAPSAEEGSTDEPAAESSAPADSPADAAAKSAPDSKDGGAGESGTTPVTPMRRGDYVPPGAGAAEVRQIPQMRPQGTIRDLPRRAASASSDSDEKPKSSGRRRAAGPQIARPPEYVPPQVRQKKKEEDAPAQKPDVPLNPEMLQSTSNPLQDQMQARKDRGRSRGGASLQDLRDNEQGGGPAAAAGGRRAAAGGRRRTPDRRDTQGRRPRGRGGPRRKNRAPVELKTSAEIDVPITMRSLSEAIGRPARQLMTILFKQDIMVRINDNIDEETALELAMEVGVDLKIRRGRDVEQELLDQLEQDRDDAEFAPRPPIVTILGHVDHGKTTLVDRIRSANVADGEAGGITQHIAAYQVDCNGQKITFVDTPGHAAFGEMRARGANVTDIVVLVVAADDGVMPQTIECISHARAAGVPIIVAMNKMDLPDTNEQRVLQELATHGVMPAEWSGDVEVVRTSATEGTGIDDLLETILLTAELQEFQADVGCPAVGVCLEAFRDEGRGALSWVVVQKGILRSGDIMLCGTAFGRVRAIYNDRDEELQEALPSTPVRIAGLDSVPGAGDHFFVLDDVEEARRVAEERRHRDRTEVLAGRVRPRSLDDILAAARGGQVQDLPLIIKADTPGSLEALRSEIEKFEHDEVRTQIIHEGVGGVNESDVYLASASGAIIIAFHVIAEDRAQQLADREGVDVRRYDIIYEVTETIKRSLEGMLIPDRVEKNTGRALVLQTFHISRFGTIAGCRVLNGSIERNDRIHVIRDQKILNSYGIASLRREKEDVREVREGMECGIRLEGFNDIKEGDLLQAFKIEEVKRTLE